MKWLINWIRSWFCIHEFKEYHGDRARTCGSYQYHSEPVLVVYCVKCGKHFKEWA